MEPGARNTNRLRRVLRIPRLAYLRLAGKTKCGHGDVRFAPAKTPLYRA